MTGTRTHSRWKAGAALAALVFLLPLSTRAVEVRVFTTADGLPSNWVTALAPSSGGKLWVGTGNAGIYLLDPATGKGKGYRASDGLSSDEVTSIALFRGKVYVGTSAALSVFDGSNWETIPKVGNVTMRNVRLAASPDGKELWACAVYLAGGTVRFDGNEWKFMGGAGRGLFNDIQGFAFLPDGVLMGAGSGVPYLHTGSDVLSIDKGLPPTNIFSAGTWNGKWILGTSRGLFRYGNQWKNIPIPREIGGDSPVFSVTEKDGFLIIGVDGGLVRLSDGGTVFLTVKGGLPASRVTAVAAVGNFTAAGTTKGLALIREW